MSETLTTAIEAAKKGAEHALTYFTHNPKVSIKPDNTPVTVADKETEDIIKSIISNIYPKAHFVGEETGGVFDHNDVWIIDPIDGTKNFIRGLPFWSILIAHYSKGEIVTGVSYTPLLNELVYAEKSGGTFLNDKKVSVSAINTLNNAFMSYPGNPDHFVNKRALVQLINTCMASRGFGDAFAYQLLSSGRIDINLEQDVKVWDVAPFKIIIEEAGGKVTNLKGDEWSVTDTDILATNGTLHTAALAILNQKS